jgi:hypothetical protein
LLSLKAADYLFMPDPMVRIDGQVKADSNVTTGRRRVLTAGCAMAGAEKVRQHHRSGHYLFQADHVRTGLTSCRWRGDFGQKCRRDIPPAAIVGDDRDRFPVVASHHALDPAVPLWLERDPIANFELQHLPVSQHLLKKAKSFDDPVVEIDEFRFGQLVDINRHSLLPSPSGLAWIP